ncbi:MAG: TonB-dependent receptor [Acidobacteria bacterium]|nr:TonB-dependent receptor [Acidobacteriota bacterium]
MQIECFAVRKFVCLAVLVTILSFLSLTSAPLFGQETGGTISGTLKDASGAVVVGARVTVTNKSTGRISTTTTGSDGSYSVRQLAPGRYSIRFDMSGFAPVEVAEAELLLGRTSRIDASLQVAPVEQAVTVIETVPLVDLSSTAVGHNVTAEEFDRLPKARSFQGLLNSSPSVTTGLDQFGNIVGVEGGITVNGSSSAENQFFIDGVATNSQLYGQSRQNAPFEFLQEVQVKTGSAQAEYGGALGGVLSAVTKSGGNQFHGDLHYYFTGNGIAAGPVRRLLNPLTVGVAGYNGGTTGVKDGYVQDQKQKDKRNEFGGSLSGPLIRDTAWFFIAGSPTWRRRESVYNLTGGTDTIKQKQFYQQGFAKVDYNPFDRIRTHWTVLWTPTASTGAIVAYTTGTNGRPTTVAANQVNKQDGFYAPQTNYTGSVDITLSPKLLLLAKGGRFWDNYGVSGIPDITTYEYGNSTTNLSPALQAQVAAAGLTGGLGTGNSPRRQLIDHDLVTRAFFNADLSMVGSLWGSHDAKIGWGISKSVNNVDFSYPKGGYITAFWGQSYTSSVPGAPCATSAGCTGTYGYYTLDDSGTRGSTGGTIQSIYGQDSWKIHPRVTLSLGMRFENEKVPSFRRDVLDPAFEFNFLDKVMPRIGVAYDLLGNGNVKLSFGYGRFYDWIKYELSRGTFGGDIWTTKYRALDTLSLSSLNAGNLPGRDLFDERTPGSFQDHRIPAFSKDCSAKNLATCQVDPSLKPMGVDQLNATLEYQWGPRTLIRASYVRSDMLHTIEDMGVLVEGSENYLYVNPGEGLLGQVMTINYAATKPPADLCNKRLSGQNLTDCLAGKVFPTPKAIRTYNALELSVTRRFADNWFFYGSYVYSRLRGNHPGIANSDELRTPTTGGGFGPGQQQTTQITRQGTSAGRAWDLDEYMFDSKGNPYITGPLPTDRPHALKLYGSYNFEFGAEVGVNFLAESGTPVSTYAFTTDRVRMLVNGRGDMGRSPVLSQTDMLVAHTFNITESKKLRFEFNMVNLFNQKTSRHIFNCLNYDCVNGQVASSMNMANVNLFAGFDPTALINQSTNGRAVAAGTAGALNPFDLRYKKDDLFNPGFSGRFGIKFTF